MYLSYLDVHPVIEQMLFCLTLCSDLHSRGYSEYSLDKILLLPLFRDFSAHTEANSQRRSMCARHCVRVWINGVYVCSTKQLSVTKRKYSLYSSHDKELSIYHLFSMCTYIRRRSNGSCSNESGNTIHVFCYGWYAHGKFLADMTFVEIFCRKKHWKHPRLPEANVCKSKYRSYGFSQWVSNSY